MTDAVLLTGEEGTEADDRDTAVGEAMAAKSAAEVSSGKELLPLLVSYAEGGGMRRCNAVRLGPLRVGMGAIQRLGSIHLIQWSKWILNLLPLLSFGFHNWSILLIFSDRFGDPLG